jgi:alcohol dehydrogenase, propanol-preferring
MQAMIFFKPAPAETAPLALREVPRPEAGPGRVLIRVSVCGACHTDLHAVEGDLALPRLPLIPGHQVVGTVEACGPGVTAFAPGDRVGVAWLHETCGHCRFCTTGRENLCGDAHFTGLHYDGGFAEYLTAPADFIYRMPEAFPDEQAAPLLCAGIVGYRSLVRSGIRPGGRLGIYGFGASAHVIMQVARYWGCEVYVCSRGEVHRDLARSLGAAWVGGEADRPPVPLDSAVIFAPAGNLVLPALEALDKGGTLSLAGIHMSDIPVMNYERHLFNEKTVTSTTANTRQDGRELLDLAARIPIRSEVTVYPLEEANRALVAIKRSEVRGAAVIRVRT